MKQKWGVFLTFFAKFAYQNNNEVFRNSLYCPIHAECR